MSGPWRHALTPQQRYVQVGGDGARESAITLLTRVPRCGPRFVLYPFTQMRRINAWRGGSVTSQSTRC